MTENLIKEKAWEMVRWQVLDSVSDSIWSSVAHSCPHRLWISIFKDIFVVGRGSVKCKNQIKDQLNDRR